MKKQVEITIEKFMRVSHKVILEVDDARLEHIEGVIDDVEIFDNSTYQMIDEYIEKLNAVYVTGEPLEEAKSIITMYKKIDD